MFSTIVVGIDGRDHDREALSLAQRLADPGADIIVASVAVIADRVATPSLLASTDLVARREDDVDRLTEAHPGFQGVVTNAPSVGEGLRELALGAGADLVVVASSSRGRLGRILAGDGVRDVLRHAPCAVAVAPVDHARRAGAPVGKVLVGYADTPAAHAAVLAAIALRDRDGTEVRVVEVVEPFPAGTALLGPGTTPNAGPLRARERLDRLEAEHGVTGDVLSGTAAHELALAGRDADLLVIGLEEHSLLDRILAGSTAHALLREQTAPLLAVPQPRPVGRKARAAQGLASAAPRA